MSAAKTIYSRSDNYQLMKPIPTGDEEGKYLKEFINGLLKARQDLKRGKTIPHEELKKILKM